MTTVTKTAQQTTYRNAPLTAVVTRLPMGWGVDCQCDGMPIANGVLMHDEKTANDCARAFADSAR